MQEIPALGYGTYKILQNEVKDLVKNALEIGYRHIDTATLYRNECGISQGIKDFLNENKNINRQDLWITTKVSKYHLKRMEIEKAFLESLNNLDLDYIDLYLIHVPISKMNQQLWKKMEQIKEKYPNKLRYIGVSNFSIEQLEEILNEHTIKPYCNQFEISPFVDRHKLVQFCKHNDIKIIAHSSLTKGKQLNNNTLLDIADNMNITSSQVLLKWALQNQFAVIPMTKNLEHMKENYDIKVRNNKLLISYYNLEKLDRLKKIGFITHKKLLPTIK